MAYSKYTWQNGEVITADKLNHMEEGINNANGVPRMVIAGDEQESSTPMTWEITEGTYAEIVGAMKQKKNVDFKIYCYEGNMYTPYLVIYAQYYEGSSYTRLNIYAIKISVGSSSPTPDMRLKAFYVDENNNLTWGD